MNVRQPASLKTTSVLPLVLLGLALSGCGEERVAVHPVSGTVTYQGGVPEGAQVVLHPVSATSDSGIAAIGNVQADGSFKIGVYEDGDGAPPGNYVATVQWFRFVASDGVGGRGPNVLPDKYARAETSPIRVTVKPGANQLPPFDVTY